ncbi:hypothetical protein GDO81_026947 [Engystomops pustulosus]|uniref:Uncharacterized protein n=1 Tax=Engystomops pustulosus TaxID=76066 RepID=A0AAV6ZSN6_ENGPU|nr:hypothetical protein GDO81_026947 [Engystomops pustulosus]
MGCGPSADAVTRECRDWNDSEGRPPTQTTDVPHESEIEEMQKDVNRQQWNLKGCKI